MHITDQEKKYIIVLGVVAIVACLYLLGYKPLNTKAKSLEDEVAALQTRIEQYHTTLKPKDFYEEGIKTMGEKIEAMDSRLPQALPQELVIQTMDTLSHTLKLALPTISLSEVQPINAVVASNPTEESTEGVQGETVEEKMPQGMKSTVMTVTDCSYSELKELLTYISSLPIELAVDNVTIHAGEVGLATSFTLHFFGLDVPGREEGVIGLGPYKAGKENVFLDAITDNSIQRQVIYDDLFMIIDPVQSDNAAITIGSTKDRERKTYLYEESNVASGVEMYFSQSGNKYYVKYSIGDKNYPADGGHMVMTPSEGIGVKVHSTDRLDENDLNEVALKVINDTDKTVYFYVKNDDATKPRFQLIETKGNIRVVE